MMMTAELSGVQLDYWVARAEGKTPERIDLTEHDVAPGAPTYVYLGCGYSSLWEQGGPIIERERMSFAWSAAKWDEAKEQVVTLDPPVCIALCKQSEGRGPDHLTAAMRAYVASKFGDEVPEPTA